MNKTDFFIFLSFSNGMELHIYVLCLPMVHWILCYSNGRFVITVDCCRCELNKLQITEGVQFLEAQAKCQLSQIMQDSYAYEFNKFVMNEVDACDYLPLAIQVNFFDFGVTIGVLISHQIADGLSLVKFMQNWAATAACGASNIDSPQFVSATLFPPKNFSGIARMPKENIVLKRFVFSASMIAALREKYYANYNTSLENARHPTRCEALSAFIWSRFATAAQIYSGPNRFYAVLHSVNLRKRMVPPLPDHSFGNIFQLAVSLPSQDIGEDWYGFVSEFRDAISSINEDHVKYLQDHSDEYLDFIQEGAEKYTKGEVVAFSFTNWCNFPMYEADFGWGKPLWVGWANLSYKNLVVLMDTKCGDGIQALVHLKEEDMARFENDLDMFHLALD